MVLPQCGFYCGVDYTEEMIEMSETVCEHTEKEFPEAGEYKLHHLSFPETVQQEAAILGGPFDVCIIYSVCMYINDEELERSFALLPKLMSDHAVFSFQESIGFEGASYTGPFPIRSAPNRLYIHLPNKGRIHGTVCAFVQVWILICGGSAIS